MGRSAGNPRRRVATRGVIELTIDESGNVVNAVLRKPFNASYDALLLKAARDWKYEPARKAGVPVRFLKNVAIRLGGGNVEGTRVAAETDQQDPEAGRSAQVFRGRAFSSRRTSGAARAADRFPIAGHASSRRR